MANPLRAAAQAVIAPEGKDGDLTWYGERGWTKMLTGSGRPPSDSFEQLVFEGFRKNPVARACIQALGASLAEAPIYAYKRDEYGKWKRQVGHRVEDLFTAPNARDDYVKFLTVSLQHYFFGGNAYWRKVRSGIGRVVGLIPIRPDRVISAIVDEDDIPSGFRIRRKNSSETDVVKADDIVHIPDPDPLNAVFGTPRVLSAALELRADSLASEYVAEVLTNHGSPGLIVGVNERVSPQQIEDAEEKWGEKFGPNKGRGRVGFVAGAGMVKEIGYSLQALEFPNLRKLTRESICTIFGVDPMLIGLGSAASSGGTMSGNEYAAALHRLWMQVLVPLIRRWEAVFAMSLAPEYGRICLFFELDEIEALKPDRDAAVKRAKDMKDTGVYTVPEIRTETGHEPEFQLDADGKQPVVVMPSSVVMLTADKLGTDATARPQGGVGALGSGSESGNSGGGSSTGSDGNSTS